jgi:hypothetical protein
MERVEGWKDGRVEEWKSGRMAWSLAIYSLVFGDSAPKARHQNSLGQAKAGFGP